MRIGWWPAGGWNTASSRLRAYWPCTLMERAGWCTTIVTEHACDVDVLVLQKPITARAEALVERCRERGTKTVLDICDNVFHYRLDRPSEATEIAARVRRLAAAVDLVTSSTPTLAEVIRQETGREALIVDDVVERPRLAPRALGSAIRRLSYRQPFRLVWFGSAGMESPPHGMVDLARLLPLLEELRQELPLHLRIVSNSRAAYARYFSRAQVPTTYSEWGPRRISLELARSDACLLPVNANPLTLCKTGNRAISSLLHGVPVIADPIPSYLELEPFLVLSDWAGGLTRYARDPALRRRHVREGRAYIRRKYTPEHVVQQWSLVFERVAGGGPAPEGEPGLRRTQGLS